MRLTKIIGTADYKAWATGPDRSSRCPTANSNTVSRCNTHFGHVHTIFMPESRILALLQTLQQRNALQYISAFLTPFKSAITHPCRQTGSAKSLTCFLLVTGLEWVIKGGGLKRKVTSLDSTVRSIFPLGTKPKQYQGIFWKVCGNSWKFPKRSLGVEENRQQKMGDKHIDPDRMDT